MPDCPHFAFADSPLVRRIGLGVPALRYAELGFAVLPLQPGGKRPHAQLGNSGGVHHATRDYGQIERWWAADPRSNIGIATGQPSALAVIDLDVKGEHNGPAQFSRFLIESKQALTGGWHVPWSHTPSGGRHEWLRWPWAAPVPERPGILPGVDVKGDGGLVVAPPSMRLMTGREGDTVPVAYRWSGCPCQAPPAPEWLYWWLQRAPGGHGGGSAVADEDVPDLEELTANGLPVGERNRTMYRLACSLLRRCGTGPGGYAAVLAQLRRVWEATDKRDFGWGEVQVCAASARKFVAAQEAREEGWRQSWMQYERRRT